MQSAFAVLNKVAKNTQAKVELVGQQTI